MPAQTGYCRISLALGWFVERAWREGEESVERGWREQGEGAESLDGFKGYYVSVTATPDISYLRGWSAGILPAYRVQTA